MFGFLNLNKPSGPTSHDMVARVRRVLGRGVKVGHAGTLDPFAEGVLVICLGPATRLARYVQVQPKRYAARIMLGASSTTDDPEGQIARTLDAQPPPEAAVRETLERFVGEIDQVPPAHSAVHVDGQRAYKLARSGESVTIASRRVTIHSIDLLRYAYPELEIDVRCASGTYIRSLARDIGADLGVGGYCSMLTRTEIGSFMLTDAIDVAAIDPQRDIASPLLAVADLPLAVADDAGIRRLALGQTIAVENLQGPPAVGTGQEVAVVDEGGRLVAIAKLDPAGSVLKPSKVFLNVQAQA